MAPQQDSEQLIITEYPIFLWLIGGLAILFSFFLFSEKNSLLAGIMVLVTGLLFVTVFASVTTLICDKPSGRLSIHSRSLAHHSTKEYLLTDISSIEVESSHSRDSSPTYRIVIVLITGERVPLHSYYSSGYGGKAKTASQISTFLGLQNPPSQPAFGFQAIEQALVRTFQPIRQGETSGVQWTLEASSFGELPITRWVTEDYQNPGQFLFLVQKPDGMKAGAAANLLSGISNSLYRKVLGLYGFQEEDTPGLNAAQIYALPVPGLGDRFTAYTSDPVISQQIITPWVATLLEGWARRYPIQSGQLAEPGQPGQLSVLLSPRKLYLVFFGAADEEQAQELVQLGVDLQHEAGRIEIR